MIKIALIGANGKMGLQIARLINARAEDYTLSIAITPDPIIADSILHQVTLSASISIVKDVDVVIDFSTPKSSMLTLQQCLTHKIPLVLGTTGFNAEETALITQATQEIAVLMSPNMSLSVNMLFKLTSMAASRLNNFEAEIIETHHRYKKDAPSGTALKLGETITHARNLDLDKHAVFTRNGRDEARNPNDIGFAVVRGGDIVGKHEVMFIADGEILTLTSEINNRSSFANGALAAGAYLLQQQPGLYSMLDVLNL